MTTKKGKKEMISKRLAFRLSTLLLFVLLMALAVQQYATYMRQEEIHRATTMDFVTSRLGTIAGDVQEEGLNGRTAISELLSFFAAYSSVSAASEATYRARLEEYLATHESVLFARYIPEDGGGPALSVGEGEDIPSAGEEGSPFDPLVEASTTLKNGEVILSSLTEYVSPQNEHMLLLYGIAPVRHAGATYGYLEFGFTLMPLLEQVKQSERADEWLMLLDNNGRYLVDREGAISISGSIFNDYPPSVTDRIFSGHPSGDFIYEGKVFAFRHVMVSGMKYRPDDRQYWVLLDVSDENKLFSESATMLQQYLATAIAFLLIISVLGYLLFLMYRKQHYDHAPGT